MATALEIRAGAVRPRSPRVVFSALACICALRPRAHVRPREYIPRRPVGAFASRGNYIQSTKWPFCIIFPLGGKLAREFTPVPVENGFTTGHAEKLACKPRAPSAQGLQYKMGILYNSRAPYHCATRKPVRVFGYY